MLLPGLAWASDVPALLKKADGWRLSGESVRVETQARMFRDDKLGKERSYVVYTKPGRRSLVLMKSPVEQGQKVLMLADQFWLLMPDSQRPLRITASQKLLGEASTGDIATLTWGEDYEGKVVGEAECPVPEVLKVAQRLTTLPSPPEGEGRGGEGAAARFSLSEGAAKAAPAKRETPAPAKAGKSCLHLDLAASRPGVTYSRVDLYLEKGTSRPVKSDLYLGSGKRAKVAWYHAGSLEGKARIVGMSLLDDIQPNRRTEISYQSMTPREVPDELFNPAALVRNSLAGW